ncbi:hypothetical protein RRG08_037689 [Elysia crispata]|uniref:Uncharacterized protein n=1 Tax=Elysia crispata TaxID=231223 RepID=A0AAE1DTP6_9GAST|nr:hypothetical protein RRG08_037689 [Elysia crispata]
MMARLSASATTTPRPSVRADTTNKSIKISQSSFSSEFPETRGAERTSCLDMETRENPQRPTVTVLSNEWKHSRKRSRTKDHDRMHWVGLAARPVHDSLSPGGCGQWVKPQDEESRSALRGPMIDPL